MSKVSRSVYQKLAEENKRLKSDIYDLINAHENQDKFIETFTRWDNHFKKQKEWNSFLRGALKQYKLDNPNDPAVKASNEMLEKFPPKTTNTNN